MGELPALEGRPIEVRFRPRLTKWRGRLLSGGRRGTEVHAGSFLRRRLVVLDDELQRNAGELARILVHEAFHFVWLRLGNARRVSYESLLAGERHSRARGELGWSAERRKAGITGADVRGRTRRWREYACESFCDTAAWLYARGGRHAECTLAPKFRRPRRDWFSKNLVDGPLNL